MQNSEDYEVISNESSKIKDLERKLQQKTQTISELLAHFSDFGAQIAKKADFLSDRIQVIKLSEDSSKKNPLKDAYLSDLEEVRTSLRNLLFYKESVEQTFKKDA